MRWPSLFRLRSAKPRDDFARDLTNLTEMPSPTAFDALEAAYQIPALSFPLRRSPVADLILGDGASVSTSSHNEAE